MLSNEDEYSNMVEVFSSRGETGGVGGVFRVNCDGEAALGGPVFVLKRGMFDLPSHDHMMYAFDALDPPRELSVASQDLRLRILEPGGISAIIDSLL